MKRFLVIQTAFLGDVILATPVFSELKRIYPDCEIDVVVRNGNQSLLQNNPSINNIFVFDKSKTKISAILEILKKTRKNKYDEVINLQRYLSAGLIALFSSSKKRIGFNKSSISFIYTKNVPHSLENGQHEIERNLSTIAHHKPNKLVKPTLYPSEKDFENVQKFKKEPYYCIAPASIWFTKQLPEEKWIELIQLLTRKGKVILLGGANDIKLCETLRFKSKRNVLIAAGELSILESAALMKDALMNFCNDSGPLHIASAVNAPVRAFFCSTVPSFGFGPLSDDAKVIEVDTKLSCRPCGIHGKTACPYEHFKCAKMIEINSENLHI